MDVFTAHDNVALAFPRQTVKTLSMSFGLHAFPLKMFLKERNKCELWRSIISYLPSLLSFATCSLAQSCYLRSYLRLVLKGRFTVVPLHSLLWGGHLQGQDPTSPLCSYHSYYASFKHRYWLFWSIIVHNHDVHISHFEYNCRKFTVFIKRNCGPSTTK